MRSASAESEFLKSFEIIIQLGAILSVVVLYWRRFLDVDVLKKLVVAFIPTGVIGLTVYKAIKGYLLGSLTVVLLVAAHRRRRAHRVRALQGGGRPGRRLLGDHVSKRAS